MLKIKFSSDSESYSDAENIPKAPLQVDEGSEKGEESSSSSGSSIPTIQTVSSRVPRPGTKRIKKKRRIPGKHGSPVRRTPVKRPIKLSSDSDYYSNSDNNYKNNDNHDDNENSHNDNHNYRTNLNHRNMDNPNNNDNSHDNHIHNSQRKFNRRNLNIAHKTDDNDNHNINQKSNNSDGNTDDHTNVDNDVAHDDSLNQNNQDNIDIDSRAKDKEHNDTRNQTNGEILEADIERINEEVQNKRTECFRCHKKKQFMKANQFSFFSRDKEIFHAIRRGILNEVINITKSESPDHPFAQIQVMNSTTLFHLVREPEKTLVATIQFQRKNELVPKDILIQIHGTAFGVEKHLTNMKPFYNALKQTWQLDFKGRFVLKSNKNAIFIDEKKVVNMIVRKTNKDDLEIEPKKEFDKLLLFFICIALFVCTI